MIAYIDPGAGSFVLQAIVAALAGAALVLRGYWKRLRSRLGLRGPDEADERKGPRPGDA
jgi:hypothetical protein